MTNLRNPFKVVLEHESPPAAYVACILAAGDAQDRMRAAEKKRAEAAKPERLK